MSDAEFDWWFERNPVGRVIVTEAREDDGTPLGVLAMTPVSRRTQGSAVCSRARGDDARRPRAAESSRRSSGTTRRRPRAGRADWAFAFTNPRTGADLPRAARMGGRWRALRLWVRPSPDCAAPAGGGFRRRRRRCPPFEPRRRSCASPLRPRPPRAPPTSPGATRDSPRPYHRDSTSRAGAAVVALHRAGTGILGRGRLRARRRAAASRGSLRRCVPRRGLRSRARDGQPGRGARATSRPASCRRTPYASRFVGEALAGGGASAAGGPRRVALHARRHWTSSDAATRSSSPRWSTRPTRTLGATRAKIAALARAGRRGRRALPTGGVEGVLPENCRLRVFGAPTRLRRGRPVRLGARRGAARPQPVAVVGHMVPALHRRSRRRSSAPGACR